jgi:HlyD family secretion protein
VQIRSLVDEVDIGKVEPAQQVTIRVEAYPDRRFQGEVLKVEPQAVVQQNVTMFPVLTRIDNREGLLKPGMNAEIEILIDRRDDVLVLQNEALKRPEEARSVAALLGLEGAAAPGGGSRERPSQGTNGEGASGGPAHGSDRGGRADDGSRVIFVQNPDGSLAAKPVKVGLRNYEVAEIVSGAAEGEQVVLLPSATQLRSSAEFRQRMERMRGIPGMSSGGSSRRSGGSG